jgi:Tol biopolymer transport system component
VRKQPSSAAKLAWLLAVALLGSAACAAGTGSSGPSAPPAPASNATPTVPATPTVAATPNATPSPTATPAPIATPTPTVTPAPTPFAVKDGEPWIVYTWAPDPGLHLMRPDGSDFHDIATDLPGVAEHPDWSPDGTLIAINVMVKEGAFEIWTVKADGTDPQKLLGCEGAPCVEVGGASWSPDGRQMVFGRVTNSTGSYKDDHLTIEILDLATRKSRVIAATPPVGAEAVQYSDARWSPDGTQVVFIVNRYATPPTDENLLGSSVGIVKTDGSEVNAPRILTKPGLFGTYPDWSPDGKRIVFSTHGLGSFQTTTKASNLYTIRPDGTGLTQVTHFGDNDTRAVQPTWTPDGKRIIFTVILRNAADAMGDRHTAFIDPDGANLTILDGPFATHPRLRPTP